MEKNRRRRVGIGMVPPKTSLGQFLRVHRLTLGLTQPEMAEKLRIPQNRYSAYETGRHRRPSPALARTMVKVFHFDPEGLERLGLPARAALRLEKWVRLDNHSRTDLQVIKRRLGINRSSTAVAKALAFYRRHVENEAGSST